MIAVKDVNGLTLLDKDEHMRPTTTMQTLAQLNPSFVQMGDMAGFDAVAIQRYPESNHQSRPHAGQLIGHRRRRAAVLIGNKDAGIASGLKPRAGSGSSPISVRNLRSC